MSVDYFIITPQNYKFETFFDRFPSDIRIIHNKNEDYYIEEKDKIWHAWITVWDYAMNGFPTIEDAFTEEQMNTIRTIVNPKFFCLTARYDAILNVIVSLIANDANVLICNDTDDPIITGDEFVKLIKQGKMID